MEISYPIDCEKELQTLRYYLKNCYAGIYSTDNLIHYILWILCFWLIVLIMPFKAYGAYIPVYLYIGIVLLFMIFSKFLATQLMLWGAKKRLKKRDHGQVSIIIREESISFETKDKLKQFHWELVKKLEKTKHYLFLDIEGEFTVIPEYAFKTEEIFESFALQIKEYIEAHQKNKQNQRLPKVKALWFIPIFLGFLAILIGCT